MGNIAFLFPGQGSQYVGMAAALLADSPAAGEIFAQAEAQSGLAITRLCTQGPMDELTRTLHLQPAVTAVNLATWQALVAAGVQADYVAGHSLGEYSALAAAGVLSIEDTLHLVSERGRLMEREAAAHPGAMAAIIGLDLARVEEILAGIDGQVVVANHNTPAQIVVSGEKAAVAAAVAAAKAAGAKGVVLKVSGAWHSPLVAGAVADFRDILGGVTFHAPRVPVLLNTSGRREDDPQAIRRLLAEQIASRVRWVEIVEQLAAAGVDTFIEVGPKTVLSGLVKKILGPDGEYRILHADTPEKVAAVAAAL